MWHLKWLSCIIRSRWKYPRGNTSPQLEYQSLHGAPCLRHNSTSVFHGPPHTFTFCSPPIAYTSTLNEFMLLSSYLELPTERHMWNWEWFSGCWTGSHLHNPYNLPPSFKAGSQAFVLSLFPADQWDPDKSSATKETSFLGNFSQLVQKKKSKGERLQLICFVILSGTDRQFRIVWEEGRARRKRERDGEGEKRRLDT